MTTHLSPPPPLLPTLRISRHEDTQTLEVKRISLTSEAWQEIGPVVFAGATWKISARCQALPGTAGGGFAWSWVFTVTEGRAEQISVAAEFALPDWSESTYSTLPAAVYTGNRLPCLPVGYPPTLAGRPEARPDAPTYITDVPRLSDQPGESRLQLLTGDLATPAAGFFFPGEKIGRWFFTDQGTSVGNTGIDLVENLSRNAATLVFSAPGMREGHRYFITCRNRIPSPDRGVVLETGGSITLGARVHAFPCEAIPDLFRRFMPLRAAEAPTASLASVLPFSAAHALVHDKYVRQNWHEGLGIYCTNTPNENTPEWQMGWVGGMLMLVPFSLRGDAAELERCRRNLDFAFGPAQAPSGFFRGIMLAGKWADDSFGRATDGRRWHLLRKSADGLYFLLKQFQLLRELHPATPLAPAWIDGARRAADAFVTLWRREGQLGQFVDEDTGALLIGDSASAGIAPAALALAAAVLDTPAYRATAEEIAAHYAARFTGRGLSTGGPGEILQCPDSESAFGLLESYVVLAEHTGKPAWRELARDQAAQCASWVMSYDYRFPVASTFGALDVRTRGTVFANVQNKHSSPGICTLSGDSLFKLFRLTGDTAWLDLARDIAHALPQFVSRADRPIRASGGALSPGWICERVNTSDWLEPVGEVFNGSCWCEVSLLLSTVELPGVYLQPDTGLLRVFDHVEAVLVSNDDTTCVLELANPTAHPARVSVFAESSTHAATTPLHQLWQHHLYEIELPPRTRGRLNVPAT